MRFSWNSQERASDFSSLLPFARSCSLKLIASVTTVTSGSVIRHVGRSKVKLPSYLAAGGGYGRHRSAGGEKVVCGMPVPLRVLQLTDERFVRYGDFEAGDSLCERRDSLSPRREVRRLVHS